MPTQFTPTRTVQFECDHVDPQGNVSRGWRRGEVVAAEAEGWGVCHDGLELEQMKEIGATLRVRDPLTGQYWDVAAKDCVDVSNEEHAE